MNQESLLENLKIRLAVLEERSSALEGVLQEALRKIEGLMDKNYELNTSVVKFLTQHEEQFKVLTKATDVLNSEANLTKKCEKAMADKLEEKLTGLQTQITDLSKYRWLFAGALLLFVTAMTNQAFFTRLLAPTDSGKPALQQSTTTPIRASFVV